MANNPSNRVDASPNRDASTARTGPKRSTDTVWHPTSITRAQREQRNHHQSGIIWFTGLSGSGKSTLAHALEEELHRRNCHTFVCDGDNIRHGLCGDLGFSEQDRTENIRRIGQVSKLFIEAGVIVLTAFISPFKVDRWRVRMMLDRPEDFIEIYCKCSLEVCEQRDVKGLYQRARKGEIPNFTGISSPYEEPQNADLILDTATNPVQTCVTQIVTLLTQRKILRHNLKGGG